MVKSLFLTSTFYILRKLSFYNYHNCVIFQYICSENAKKKWIKIQKWKIKRRNGETNMKHILWILMCFGSWYRWSTIHNDGKDIFCFLFFFSFSTRNYNQFHKCNVSFYKMEISFRFSLWFIVLFLGEQTPKYFSLHILWEFILNLKYSKITS